MVVWNEGCVAISTPKQYVLRKFITTSIHRLQPYGIMLLYHDLLVIISEYLVADLSSLSKLSQVSRQTHAAVVQSLYKTVILHSLRSIGLFCNTILTGPHNLRPLVKTLWIGPAAYDRCPGIVALVSRIAAVLRQLPNLRDLSLTPMAQSFGELFTGLLSCNFRLDSLKASYHTHHSFVQFLQSQPSITRLYLHDPDTEPPRSYKLVSSINAFSAKGPFLPNLVFVSADPKVLTSLVPGRPVSHVEITVGACLHNEQDALISMVSALSQSAAPIVSIIHIPRTIRIHLWGHRLLQTLKTTHISSTLKNLTVSLPQIMRPLLVVRVS